MKNLFSLYRLGVLSEALTKALRIHSKTPAFPKFSEEIFIPGQNSAIHNGFVNCKNNDKGLKARFYRAGNGVGTNWDNSGSGYEGYPGIIHGGITASLLDELMATTAFQSSGKFGVTVKAEFKWLKTLKVGDPVTGFAQVIFSDSELARIEGWLLRSDKEVIAKGEAVFYFPTLKQFMRLAELSFVPEDVTGFFRNT
jgi:hypothetical protein